MVQFFLFSVVRFPLSVFCFPLSVFRFFVEGLGLKDIIPDFSRLVVPLSRPGTVGHVWGIMICAFSCVFLISVDYLLVTGGDCGGHVAGREGDGD